MTLEQYLQTHGLQNAMQQPLYLVEHQYRGATYSDCFETAAQALQEAQTRWKHLPAVQQHHHHILVWSARLTGTQIQKNGEDLFELDFLKKLWDSKQ